MEWKKVLQPLQASVPFMSLWLRSIILHQEAMFPIFESYWYLVCRAYCQCLSFESLPSRSAVWLPACSHMRNGFGSVQKGLTFVRRICWLSWHFDEILTMRYCRRRGNVNLDGVVSSKRSLFWMIVVIAAACSMLHERAAFATSRGGSERTLFCSFVFMVGLCREPVSHFMWRVWRMETSGSKTCWVCFFRFP